MQRMKRCKYTPVVSAAASSKDVTKILKGSSKMRHLIRDRRHTVSLPGRNHIHQHLLIKIPKMSRYVGRSRCELGSGRSNQNNIFVGCREDFCIILSMMPIVRVRTWGRGKGQQADARLASEWSRGLFEFDRNLWWLDRCDSRNGSQTPLIMQRRSNIDECGCRDSRKDDVVVWWQLRFMYLTWGSSRMLQSIIVASACWIGKCSRVASLLSNWWVAFLILLQWGPIRKK